MGDASRAVEPSRRRFRHGLAGRQRGERGSVDDLNGRLGRREG
jgi:hypothetical protein